LRKRGEFSGTGNQDLRIINHNGNNKETENGTGGH